MGATKEFVIKKGKTFSHTLRWEAPPYVYKAITAITQGAPARVTVTGHGIPDGWRAAIVSAKGMVQINAANLPPKAKDFHKVTVIDANTVEFNDINSSDFKVYVSGGYLQFLTPVDMAGFTARMSIKDKVGGTELLRLDTTNSRITIDNTAKTIALTIDAATTAALNFKKGVYDLEMVSGDATPVVTSLLEGAITVSTEVTTN